MQQFIDKYSKQIAGVLSGFRSSGIPRFITAPELRVVG
jgi:hypothetical protein